MCDPEGKDVMAEVTREVEEFGELVGAADKGPKLIQRMLVTSYVIPDGQIWRFKHENGCVNVRHTGRLSLPLVNKDL